jgi:hypothetical protein|nr:MAG TPA: HK97 Family Phage Portal Protein [Caudoviricetes sp.]
MKAIDIKSARPFQTRNDKSLGIQTYGEENNFPQLVSKIIGASCTGKSCLKVYYDFVYGQGFNDDSLQSLVVNRRRETLGKVLKSVSADLTKYNGFVLHVNYNAMCQIVELYHGPFEHYRFEKVDTETGHFSKIAEHDDWAREFEGIKRFRKQDIVFYDLFDPRPEAIRAQVEAAGGWENYRGQILYYSGDGDLVYPVPIYEPELTDMRTEEGLANVTGRNVNNNFLTAGALVDVCNESESEAEAELTKKTIREFQGDDKAGQMLYLQVRSKDEIPVFMSFSGENYDKAFSVTQDNVPNNIGRVFNQPPILRAQDVGANFGADLMVNAYNYYNTKTSGERQTLEETFAEIFRLWPEPVVSDFSIRPLSYVAGQSLLARLGQSAVDKIYEIVKDTAIDDLKKKSMLRLGYDLTPEEVDELVPNTQNLAK